MPHESETSARPATLLMKCPDRKGLVWIRAGAVIVDVGSTRTPKGIVGGVEFEAARRRASFITPVPGGVGPMTVAMLLRTLLEPNKSVCR